MSELKDVLSGKLKSPDNHMSDIIEMSEKSFDKSRSEHLADILLIVGASLIAIALCISAMAYIASTYVPVFILKTLIEGQH